MSSGTVKNLGATGIGSLQDGLKFNSGLDNFRIIVRGGLLSIDKALTPTGFAGAESADSGVTGDWVNLTQF